MFPRDERLFSNYCLSECSGFLMSEMPDYYPENGETGLHAPHSVSSQSGAMFLPLHSVKCTQKILVILFTIYFKINQSEECSMQVCAGFDLSPRDG